MTHIRDSLPDILRVKRSSALYNAHSYLTKVPEGAIIPFICEFTEPGDLIVDPFAGSGMTAVAALLTGRRAVVSDISRLGQHIGQNYCRVVDDCVLQQHADSVVHQCLERYGRDYETTCGRCSRRGVLHRVVWSEVFACSACGAEVVFYDAMYDSKTKAKRSSPSCPNGHPFRKRGSRRVSERPVEIHYTCACSETIMERKVQPDDLAQIAAIETRPIADWWPDVAFNHEMEMYNRCALAKNGRTHLGDFFTHRNLNMLACLWASINQIDDCNYREKLRFAFTAILGRSSKRYQWGPKRPLNAQNQTYYVAPVFYEWSVLDLFLRKVRAIIDAMEALPGEIGAPKQAKLWDPQLQTADVEYRIASAHRLGHLGDASVDYVFTDPPFGSNIFYSDMNFFAEAWLGEFTDVADEAVVYTTSPTRKTLEEYRVLLTKAFREVYRILKPGRWASVVFSSSRGEVWCTFQHAIREAGFVLEDTQISILDKGQRSVKGLASDSENVVTVDLILSLHKATHGQTPPANDVEPLVDLDAIVSQVVCTSSMAKRVAMRELSTSYLYIAVVRECLYRHISVESVNMEIVVSALHRIGYKLDERSQSWLPPTSEGRAFQSGSSPISSAREGVGARQP